MDVLTVMVEVDESMFSDEIRKLDALRDKICSSSEDNTECLSE